MFLKKSPCPAQLTRNDFFEGARVHIYSRDLDLVDFADRQTREKLQSRLQKCAAVFTPETASHWGTMLDAICNDLDITALRTVMLDDQLAARVSAMSGSQHDRQQLARHLTTDPVLVGMFRGGDALNTLARHAEKLRKDFAADEVRCAIIAPNDVSQLSMIESSFFGPQPLPHTATLDSCTCCLILPHTVKEKNAGKVISHISSQVSPRPNTICHTIQQSNVLKIKFVCSQGIRDLCYSIIIL